MMLFQDQQGYTRWDTQTLPYGLFKLNIIHGSRYTRHSCMSFSLKEDMKNDLLHEPLYMNPQRWVTLFLLCSTLFIFHGVSNWSRNRRWRRRVKSLMLVFLKPLPTVADTNGLMRDLRVKGVWMLVT